MALLFQKEISTTEMWDRTDIFCLLFSSAPLQLPIWDSVLICDDVADWLNELQELGWTVGFLTAFMFVPYQNTEHNVILYRCYIFCDQNYGSENVQKIVEGDCKMF